MEKPPKPVSSIPPFGVRMQPALKEALDREAKANARSLNAEVVARLEESLQGAGSVSDLKRAILRVLRFEEFSLLMGRVTRLGGTEAVLATPENEIKKRIDGPAIERTPEEAKSYFSQTVAQTPLTAVLTTEEIDAIASRMVQIQQVHKVLVTKKDTPHPDQVFEKAVNGPPSDDPPVRAEQEKRGLIPPSDETPKK